MSKIILKNFNFNISDNFMWALWVRPSWQVSFYFPIDKNREKWIQVGLGDFENIIVKDDAFSIGKDQFGVDWIGFFRMKRNVVGGGGG